MKVYLGSVLLQWMPCLAVALLLPVAIMSDRVYAQGQPAQQGVVAVDGAAIYQAPSFDAPVVGYSPLEQKVILSREPMLGEGGFGLFYRVRTPDGTQGFITDVDVVPQFEFRPGGSGSRRSRDASSSENPDFRNIRDFQENVLPMFFTRYMGLGGGYVVNYGEKFSDGVLSSNTPFLGFKMTGPEVLFDGPPIDFNVALYPSAPSFYREIASPFSSGASGFLLLSDIHLLFPLVQARQDLVTIGFGPMLALGMYNVPVYDQDQALEVDLNSTELRLGLSLSSAYTRRLGRWALRAEAKYYIEKTYYPGLWLSLLREY